MIKDIIDSLKEQAEHRLGSPIFGSLVLSWLGWNYKYLLILATGLPIAGRFQLAEELLYPDWWHYWGRLYLGPVACSLAYIFLYPLLSIRLLSYWERRAMKMRDRRNEIQRQTLLTREESFQITELARKRHEADRAIIESQAREIEGLHSARQQSSGLAEDQRQRLAALEHQTKRRETEDSKLRPLEHLDPATRTGVEDLIKFLVTIDGQEATPKTIQEKCGWNQAQARYFIEKATETSVAQINPTTGGILVQGIGREYAFRNGYIEQNGKRVVQFADGATEAAVSDIIRHTLRNRNSLLEATLPKLIDHNGSMTGRFIDVGVQQGLLKRFDSHGGKAVEVTEEGKKFATQKEIS
jgi:hypothetical protein